MLYDAKLGLILLELNKNSDPAWVAGYSSDFGGFDVFW